VKLGATKNCTHMVTDGLSFVIQKSNDKNGEGFYGILRFGGYQGLSDLHYYFGVVF